MPARTVEENEQNERTIEEERKAVMRSVRKFLMRPAKEESVEALKAMQNYKTSFASQFLEGHQ